MRLYVYSIVGALAVPFASASVKLSSLPAKEQGQYLKLVSLKNKLVTMSSAILPNIFSFLLGIDNKELKALLADVDECEKKLRDIDASDEQIILLSHIDPQLILASQSERMFVSKQQTEMVEALVQKYFRLPPLPKEKRRYRNEEFWDMAAYHRSIDWTVGTDDNGKLVADSGIGVEYPLIYDDGKYSFSSCTGDWLVKHSSDLVSEVGPFPEKLTWISVNHPQRVGGYEFTANHFDQLDGAHIFIQWFWPGNLPRVILRNTQRLKDANHNYSYEQTQQRPELFFGYFNAIVNKKLQKVFKQACKWESYKKAWSLVQRGGLDQQLIESHFVRRNCLTYAMTSSDKQLSREIIAYLAFFDTPLIDFDHYVNLDLYTTSGYGHRCTRDIPPNYFGGGGCALGIAIYLLRYDIVELLIESGQVAFTRDCTCVEDCTDEDYTYEYTPIEFVKTQLGNSLSRSKDERVILNKMLILLEQTRDARAACVAFGLTWNNIAEKNIPASRFYQVKSKRQVLSNKLTVLNIFSFLKTIMTFDTYLQSLQ